MPPAIDPHQTRHGKSVLKSSNVNSPKRLFSDRTMNAAVDRIEPFQTLQALPVSIAILDASGTIVAVNDAWKEFGRRNGLRIPRFGCGASYLKYCRSKESHISRFATKLRRVLAGRLDLLTFVYPCHSPNENRWFCLIALPLSLDEPAGVAVLHVNLTEMLGRALAGPRSLKGGQGGRTGRMAGLGAISSAIKQSAAEALSAQLGWMLPAPSRESGSERALTHADRERVAAARLSRRQMQILRLLGSGKTNKEIADLLFRSPNTIKLHVSAILQRLKVKSRTQAALLASRLNEVDPLASRAVRSLPHAAARPRRERASLKT